MSKRMANQTARAGALLLDAQPRYASVANALAGEILDGRRAVGSMLPTEQELCSSFGVSRSTVREALRRLRELGLVAGAQGVGTRVIADRPRSNYVLAVRSVTEVMGYSTRTRLDIQHRQRVTADAALADRIGGEAGRDWVHVAGLRRPEDAQAPPISWVELYIDAEFAGIAESPELVTTPAYRLIATRLGIPVGEVVQEMGAIALPAAQAAALGAAPGSPGLLIRRRFHAADGRLLESTENTHAAIDRFAYSLRLGAPEAEGAAD
jgi:GntR family transcriptional regulator